MTTLPHEERVALESAQERITRMISSGAPLRETLEELMRIVEGMTASGMIGSILIRDDEGRHLLHGAGPSLPDAYNAAIDGIEIGPEVGSCGTAAFHDKTVSAIIICSAAGPTALAGFAPTVVKAIVRKPFDIDRLVAAVTAVAHSAE